MKKVLFAVLFKKCYKIASAQKKNIHKNKNVIFNIYLSQHFYTSKTETIKRNRGNDETFFYGTRTFSKMDTTI